MIAALTDKLSQEPCISLNPHCLSERTLYHLFDEVFVQRIRPESSKDRTRAWLENIGLLTPIVMDEYPDRSAPSTRFYRLDLSRRAQSQPDPLELLQAYDPDGVVCYFSALAFYSLTTQPPAHHHIATLTDPRPKPTAVPPRTGEKTSRPPRKKADPLGQWRYTYQGLRYYQTSREKWTVPGIQTRFLGATTLVRITTIEQTLLDTLHRPLSCGGPAVVMEAWEQGIDRAKEGKLASYLRTIDRSAIVQRVGYILERIGHEPGSELGDVLQEYLARLDPEDPASRHQLFPGMQYACLKQPWMIYGPA
jgi:hypothetical protein